MQPVALLLALSLLSTPSLAIEVPWIGSFFSDDEQAPEESKDPSDRPGTKEWWGKHGGKAEFVPGEGYRVPGFEGRFDKQGRPIDAPIDEITVKLIRETEEEVGILPGVDPKATAEKVREAVGYGPNQTTAREALDKGVLQFKEQQYSKAAKSFEKAASRWPGTMLEAKAMFNRGEALFFDEKYDEASDAYIALLDKHPNTPRLNDAIERLWGIAQHWERSYFDSESHAPLDMNLNPWEKSRPKTDRIGNALRLYEAIRLNDPTGPRADDAIMATAGAHFRRARYRDADYYYGLLRREYPRSQSLFEAHILGLQCKMKVYQGPEYDSTPLDEAKKLEERIRTNFAGRLDEEETLRLREARAQLLAMVEERDLLMASYYEGTEHFGAAKVYLNKVLQERPNSPTADKARETLAEIDGEPETPATRMAWFVELFPTNRHREAIDSITEVDPRASGTMVAENPNAEEVQRR